MKLWQVLEQGESGSLVDEHKIRNILWMHTNVSSEPRNLINFYTNPSDGVSVCIEPFDLNQEVSYVPNAPYLVEIRSVTGRKFHLSICKHVPHIPEEPSDELYVFEIKTLMHVKAESLEDAYNQLPDHIRASANDIVCEYNEEETLAARGELK